MWLMIGMTFALTICRAVEEMCDIYGWNYRILYFKTAAVYLIYPLTAMLELYLIAPIKHKLLMAVPYIIEAVIVFIDIFDTRIVYSFREDHTFRDGPLVNLPGIAIVFYAVMLAIYSIRVLSKKEISKGCIVLFIVATAAFFLAGFETIPQGIEDAGGDIKSVGKTVVLSVGLACLFYALLLICFGIGWPWRQFANMPRPAAATMFLSLFPGVGGKLLYWVLILGAIAGLFTTWNGFFTPSANLLMSMGRGKLVFPFFARQNSGGVAVYGQLFVLILSCCGPFLGPNLIDSITSFSGAAFILSWMITAWSLVMCRVRYPDKKRPYRIPGGIATGIFAGTVSSAAFIFMFVPSSPFYIGATAVKMFFGWLAVGLLFYLASFPQRRKLTNEELEMGVFGSALSDAEKEG